MKNRATLSLVEMLIMVAVLAVAVALCLSVFVAAKQITARTEVRDFTVSLAERGAEAAKAAAGDPLRLSEILSGEMRDGAVILTEGDYTLTVTPRTEGSLGLARVTVTHGGETAVEITASYPLPDGREVQNER